MAKKQRTEKRQRKRQQKLSQLQRHPPRLGHETMMILPAFRTAATALIEHLRVPPARPVRLVSEEDLALPVVDTILRDRYAMVRQLHGWSHENGIAEIQQLCTHLETAANHVLAGKKTFWVSPDLAEALRQTNLDVPADVLKLPFPACAFVFNDSPTLELAQTLIDRHTDRRAPYRTLTVYVHPARDGEAAGFDFTFLADAYDGEWPYMIGRSVLTDAKRNLDEILDSHPEESTDGMFWEAEMAELLRLAVNAVLYTTSADFRKELRSPAPPGLTGKHATMSGEQVFYLPGRIRVGAASEGQRPPGGHGTSVHKRFWVRGHWRRPNPSWQDQRVRWIAPYLKGPDVAVIIEREYELVGGPSGDS